MVLRVLQIITALLIALGACAPVMATLLHWNIEGTFEDDARLAGGFDFNTVTGAFSNISMTSGAGSDALGTELMGWHYDDTVNVVPGTTFGLQFEHVTPLPEVGDDVVSLHDLFIANFNPGV